MYTFKISEEFLSEEEQLIFENYLGELGLDSHIWGVFECLFRSGLKHTRPCLLKAYENSELSGAIILIRCGKYGKALFNNPLLSGLSDLIAVPVYLWLRLGCCMDMMSNPGFVRDPEKAGEVISAMVAHMKKRFFITIINGYADHISDYPEASVLPALPHGLIDTSGMSDIKDYTRNFKNIKRKNREFRSKGGAYSEIEKNLDADQLADLKRCFIATSKKSVFYLPYQDLYLNTALNTSETSLENVMYFLATLNGEFLGYQAAVKTGNKLNALHGAFDRNRKTTYHAYDILYEKMTAYAIDHGLSLVDVGPVVNYTKQKMVNQLIPMSYFLMSKYPLVQKVFRIFMKITKIQGTQQMKFRNNQVVTMVRSGGHTKDKKR